MFPLGSEDHRRGLDQYGDEDEESQAWSLWWNEEEHQQPKKSSRGSWTIYPPASFSPFFLCQLISIITNIGGRSSDVVSLQIIDPLAFLSSLIPPISKSYGFLSLQLRLGPILKLIKGNNNLLSFVTYH